ncbi:OstA-like protein [Mucilaginibacter defluvii]|uniref:OstA-like protein n=1 Tax=Mucilaginibacter defluvii TaxID=1196019 RepID=UPI0031E792BF
MNKCLLSILLLLLAGAAFGQQKKSQVRLTRSDRSEGIKRNGKDILKVFNGTFQQDFSILQSDSAYFYPQDNAFDAFGNVHITQGDTLNIYGDKLNYNGNTKTAILTNNVRMIDKDAILTTDYLTYNTATRIGTYTGGGKLINKDNTLTSKNGYYFASSRDAYFRYDVVLNTVDALIKTDTMRYNSGSRIAYFYGPTNIYGKAKDKDTLYTEFGTYNTVNEQAFFTKNNLYKQGTKSLKGDTLFYDRLLGLGRAIKRITFIDREQKITMKGDLGIFNRKEERTLVTENAYIILVTEEKDTTKTDTIQKLDKIKTDSLGKVSPKKPAKPLDVKVLSATIKKPAGKPKGKSRAPATTSTSTIIINEKGERIKVDSVYMSADTLETQMFTYKNLKALQEQRRLANFRDTSVKPAAGPAKPKPIVYKTSPKVLTLNPPAMRFDTGYRNPMLFGKPKPQPVRKDTAQKSTKTKKDSTLKTDTTAKANADTAAKLGNIPGKVDSVYMTTKVKLSDTSRVRVIFAYHDARIYKSDLQAKADSMFYSYADSTIRCYVKPIMWTQGSQLSGDTINLQMKNKKLDNMDIFYNSFVVNVDKDDSTHFNQVGGKKMRGFFKDNKLNVMFVDGNAESIYFDRDSTTKTVTGMGRSLSSRMRIRFAANKPLKMAFLSKPDIRYGPLGKFTEDDRILKGFIWKPKERPASKEAVINSARRSAAKRAAERAEAAAAEAKKAAATKGASKTPGGAKEQSSSGNSKKPAVMQQVNPTDSAARDSSINVGPGNLKDVNRNRVQDGTLNTAPVIMPAVVPQKDTATVARPPANQPTRRDSTFQ